MLFCGVVTKGNTGGSYAIKYSNMEIAASKEDTKTSIQLIKNGKPTFWLIGAITFEVAADIALAAGAFKLMKLFKK